MLSFVRFPLPLLLVILLASAPPSYARDSLNTLLASLTSEKSFDATKGMRDGIELKVQGKKLLPASPKSRLAKLNADLLQHYDLILFVNKSNSGPYAQRLIWFKPTSEDRSEPWTAEKIWKVSTGR